MSVSALDEAVIGIELHHLIETLEKEILKYVENAPWRIIVPFINESIIYTITKDSRDRPELNLTYFLKEEGLGESEINELLNFFYTAIHNYLRTMIPCYSPIDFRYKILNRGKIDLLSYTQGLLIKRED